MRRNHFPIILSAPSGAGKTSLACSLIQKIKTIEICVSNTSRISRSKEDNKLDYGFVQKNFFPGFSYIEWTGGYGKFYSTPTRETLILLAKSCDIIFDIDVVGGLTLRNVFPSAMLVYIVPPSFDLLQFRLGGRRTETTRRTARRMRFRKIFHIMLGLLEYDYIIPNYDFEDTSKKLLLCVENHRRRFSIH